MAVNFADQYFVEKSRGYKYQYSAMALSFLVPLFHGILFFWIPWGLRHLRDTSGLRFKPYFTFIKCFDSMNRVFKIRFFGKDYYYQPSLLIVILAHLAINVEFCFLQTKDLTNFPFYYTVGKRFGRLAVANLPCILLLVAHGNIISALSGLPLDKTVFFHKYLGRMMFVFTTIHMVISLKYWLDLKFYIMVQIPPQIFGFISYSCLGMLNVASFRFIRNFAFDFFLVEHRIFNFIMLLFAYFHNGANHLLVLLGVHLVVLDRIVARVMGILHKRKGPTKGISDFEILDETTLRITIPIKVFDSDQRKWWWCIVPRYGNWRAGQHILLNVSKVSLFQYHPFTIASLSDSGKMVILMKVRKGFTRKLKLKLLKMKEEKSKEDEESIGELTDISSTGIVEVESESSSQAENESANSKSLLVKETTCEIEELNPSESAIKEILTDFPKPQILTLKAGINGPVGGNYQPLTKFDSVIFLSAGSGASFTLPVALDLLKVNKERDLVDDYLYRPQKTKIKIVMAIKKLKNLQWYDHLWEEFIPFITAGKVHLIVQVTQENPEPVESSSEKSFSATEGEKNPFSSSRVRTYSSISSSSFGNESNFTILYGRPDLKEYISRGIQEECDKNYRKAFACLGCGPTAFNGEIHRICEKDKWIDAAPQVYCYTESFG
ncbi:hypothetical protein A9F13_01g00132 [Clavispora lusitaniae]|uniref:Ferric reductase transmembrane component n=1 Tax=Clavispora lusitaniae TaxID=36911 RepID=A0AA91T3P0_CLALS|nr:hypothetical protein A9F13_01g00132 [Clavispora lusitaniae]